MRLYYLLIGVAAAALLTAGAGSAPAAAALFTRPEENYSEGVEREVAVDPNVVVMLTLTTGNVIVRGWERAAVRARSIEAEHLVLRHAPANPEEPKAVKRVDVIVSEDETGLVGEEGEGSGSVELDVPRGATVMVRVRTGDIDVAGIAEARLQNDDGDIDVRQVTRALEATSINGEIYVRDSSGRARLRTISSDIEAVNLRAAADSDHFMATSTSGSIRLERVAHARVEASTVSGDVRVLGAIAPGAAGNFKTHSGDITLELPGDASFKINAGVVAGGDIITDFPVKYAGGLSSLKDLSSGRLTGSVGAGGAEINLSSFSGTLLLRKRE